MNGILTLSIGDIHGEDVWTNLGDIESLINSDGTKTPRFDKYIFVGDYVDSFFKTDKEIYDNLINIINFKKMYPNNVILLFGNHDIQYVMGKYYVFRCTGFRDSMYPILHELFNNNIGLFSIAFGYGKTLWTHAGINEVWYRKSGIQCFNGDAKKLAAKLNNMFENDVPDLYDIGFIRGGMENVGGPLWLDKSKLYKNPRNGYDQIVGHTNVKLIETYNINGNVISFIDTLSEWIVYNAVIDEKIARSLVRFINKK